MFEGTKKHDQILFYAIYNGKVIILLLRNELGNAKLVIAFGILFITNVVNYTVVTEITDFFYISFSSLFNSTI